MDAPKTAAQVLRESTTCAHYYGDKRSTLYEGDCREVMAAMPASSVDTIITDPPYGLSFMGKGWDHAVPGADYWRAALRVAKPGAMLLAFGGTRTFHRLTSAIEDAGWAVRDCLSWLYGSGFPKSRDISKATDAAQLWRGWGTALKPAWEPIILAMKPLDGTFAENAKRHGVAGLAIDASRIELNGDYKCKANGRPSQTGRGDHYDPAKANIADTVGRWPANVILDEDAAPEQTWSRFFYCAKANRSERGSGNTHPTVKPLALMQYLCRLTSTPTGGVVLDPFAGSGSTMLAAMSTGRTAIGVELETAHCHITAERLREARAKRIALKAKNKPSSDG